MSDEATPKRGLGRGLSALLGDSEDTVATASYEGGLDRSGTRVSKSLPIEFLRPNPRQPRKRFDEAAIDSLVESIRHQGILQPLLVRPHPDDANAYEIVAGERRWRAAQRARLHEVPVVIKDLTDTEAMEIALVENIHREDLTPIEEAEGYQRLIEEFNYTQEALAKGVGKSRSHVANMLRLLSLPEEIKSMLDDGQISAGHARALLAAPNAETLAHQVVSKGLNVRQTERLVQDNKPDADKTRAGLDRLKGKIDRSAATDGGRPALADKDANTLAMERSLTDLLGMAVTIDLKGDGEAGRLVVAFSDFAQLDDVIDRLNSGGPRPVRATVSM
jgi:ParB family chromosome partitioning protein